MLKVKGIIVGNRWRLEKTALGLFIVDLKTYKTALFKYKWEYGDGERITNCYFWEGASDEVEVLGALELICANYNIYARALKKVGISKQKAKEILDNLVDVNYDYLGV